MILAGTCVPFCSPTALSGDKVGKRAADRSSRCRLSPTPLLLPHAAALLGLPLFLPLLFITAGLSWFGYVALGVEARYVGSRRVATSSDDHKAYLRCLVPLDHGLRSRQPSFLTGSKPTESESYWPHSSSFLVPSLVAFWV